MTTLDDIEIGTKPARGADGEPTWHRSACILCECNCGVEIRLGADGHTFDRVRGDKDHPASKGYTCEKALRLDKVAAGQFEAIYANMPAMSLAAAGEFVPLSKRSRGNDRMGDPKAH